MSEILNWVADAVLVLLLGGTLIVAVRLDRALRIVSGDRAAFEVLIDNLGAATNAVKVGIQALRTEAERAAEQIERRSEDADKMATDLSFLIEAADRAGARLEQRLTAAPKTVLPQSKVATAAYRLRGTVRFPRLRRREEATAVRARPATDAAQPSAPAAAPHLAPIQAATISFVDDTPASLRQMAGITTRRRVLEQPAEQAGPDISAWGMPRGEAHLEAVQMKRVG